MIKILLKIFLGLIILGGIVTLIKEHPVIFFTMIGIVAVFYISRAIYKSEDKELALRKQKRRKMLEEVANGKYVFKIPMQLEENETCYYSDHAVRYEERSVGNKTLGAFTAQGGHGGVKIQTHIKGLEVYGGTQDMSGQFVSESRKVEDLVQVDTGWLIVTDKRIIYLGDKTTLVLPLDKIFRVKIAEFWSLVFNFENQPTGLEFKVKDIKVFRAAIERSGWTAPQKLDRKMCQI